MPVRPRLLDLFCGAGGCAVGYHRAGFDVVGLDHKPQKRYPFPMVVADAMKPPFDLSYFDAIHASPPCQRYSCGSLRAGTSHRHPDSIGPVRQMLELSKRPWVIENVPGAPVRTWLFLCGSMFGLELRRHRYFETGGWELPSLQPFTCDHSGRIFSVFGHGSGNRNGNRRPDAGTVAEWKRAMGIGWMTRNELAQAIPPAYTEFIGRQLMEAIRCQ